MTLALQPDELSDLTGKVRPSAQVRALRAMGIDHLCRPDGSVVVLRETLQRRLASAKLSGSERAGINWE